MKNKKSNIKKLYKKNYLNKIILISNEILFFIQQYFADTTTKVIEIEENLEKQEAEEFLNKKKEINIEIFAKNNTTNFNEKLKLNILNNVNTLNNSFTFALIEFFKTILNEIIELINNLLKKIGKNLNSKKYSEKRLTIYRKQINELQKKLK